MPICKYLNLIKLKRENLFKTILYVEYLVPVNHYELRKNN